MKKGLRIIERLLDIDKIEEAVADIGDVRALGCERKDLVVMPPVKWVFLTPKNWNRLHGDDA